MCHYYPAMPNERSSESSPAATDVGNEEESINKRKRQDDEDSENGADASGSKKTRVFEKTVIREPLNQIKLFKAVRRSMAENVMELPEVITDNFSPQGCFPIGETKRDLWAVGLRETMKSALEREMFWNRGTKADDYVMIEIQFTAEGLAHYSATNAGQAWGFPSMLVKKQVNNPYDQLTWQFNGPLFFQHDDEQGNVLVRSFLRQVPTVGML